MAVTHNRIICFRVEEELDHRIQLIQSRYHSRSNLIRTAIEMLLAKEDGKARLHAAQIAIQW